MSLAELDKLHEREQALMALLPGSSRPQDIELEQRVYGGYREVHRRYTELVASAECANEALKRALFIQWFSVVEPSWLSGIGELDEGCGRRVLDELERRATSGELDDELRGMVAWYFVVAAFAFGPADARPRMHALAGTLMQKPPQVRRPLPTNRGQLSDYWNSLRKEALP